MPLEVAAAYAAIVNKGIYVEPYFVEKTMTSTGRTLQQHMPQAHQAMDPRHAYVLTRILRGVATHGTAAAGAYGLAQIELDVGGKTGTTNAYTDAWFVGFTPRYTLLTWVGYDKKRSLGRGMTGAAAALPVWTTLLKRGMEEGWIPAGETFERPPGIVDREDLLQAGFHEIHRRVDCYSPRRRATRLESDDAGVSARAGRLERSCLSARPRRLARVAPVHGRSP